MKRIQEKSDELRKNPWHSREIFILQGPKKLASANFFDVEGDVYTNTYLLFPDWIKFSKNTIKFVYFQTQSNINEITTENLRFFH